MATHLPVPGPEPEDVAWKRIRDEIERNADADERADREGWPELRAEFSVERVSRYTGRPYRALDVSAVLAEVERLRDVRDQLHTALSDLLERGEAR